MSLLINLLPDLRQTKLRERRRRQLVGSISVIIWVVCGGIVVLLGVYAGGQSVIITNDTNSINNRESQLKAIPGLLDAYTAEQHLTSLSGLYSRRVYLTKFLQAYSASDPTNVSLLSLTVDQQNNLTAQGTAPNYASVAKLARALAASNVTVGQGASTSNMPYFSAINITSASATANNINFSLTATLSSGVVSHGQQ